MMKKLLTTTLIVAGLALWLGGCADDGEYVTVEGRLALTTSSGTSGFDFETPVPLAARAAEAEPGCAAGACVISLDEDGVPAFVDVWIERGTDGDQGLGFRAFEISISDESAALAATVAGSDGEDTFYASGGASCSLSGLESVSSLGEATLVVDCELFSDTGESVTATADLLLTGCAVQ